MVKKNFLFIIISLFVIAFAFSGCNSNDKSQQKVQIEPDVPTSNTQVPVEKVNQSIVDSTFDNTTSTVENNSVVEIGSLI